MKTARFDAVVVAQYFQPLHAGHAQVLRQAQRLAPQVVLLCLGADRARSLQAPWTTAERLAGLTALAGSDAAVTVLPLRDVSYQPQRWRQRAASVVAAHCGRRANVAVISDAQAADVLPLAWQRLNGLSCIGDKSERARHMSSKGRDAAGTQNAPLIPTAFAMHEYLWLFAYEFHAVAI